MAYLPKLNPTVGGGLGGLPERGVSGGDVPTPSYTNWVFPIYANVSFSTSAQDINMYGLAFSVDGDKMYTSGITADFVYEYDLSTNFDISTAVYNSVSFYVGGQEAQPSGIHFSTDGDKMYVVGNGSDRVFEYDLSTPWDLSTASYNSVNLSISAQDNLPADLTFNVDGDKMYVVGQGNDNVYQYTLSTPWDLSTASYDSKLFSILPEIPAGNGIAINDDGTRLYICDNSSSLLYIAILTTAFDVSTASLTGSITVNNEDTSPKSIWFAPDGSKMFMMGDTNDSVFEYSIA